MRDSVLSFEEIRPYRDDEVKTVMARLAQKPSFKVLLQYMFPDQDQKKLENGLLKIDSTFAFQAQYISRAIQHMIDDSMGELTHGGFERISKNKGYLYISNHRDIILDSALLNYKFYQMGIETAQMAIGDNLLVSGLVTDLLKLNKSFIVHRNLERKDRIPYSNRLSAYIRDVLASNKSIWMAQRSGRAKDGNDLTNPGLIKMLSLAGGDDYRASFKALQMVPMAVSYEFEPCDMLKAEELVHTMQDLPYEKDDKIGMIRGIRDPKGRVHVNLGKVIEGELAGLQDEKRVNGFFKNVAELLDQEILKLYKLWPNNYIAYDLLSGDHKFDSFYSSTDKETFLDYAQKKLAPMKGDPQLLNNKFLEIYANPLKNKIEANLDLR